MTLESAFTGCMVGLAVGDALGYPHEFRAVAQVRNELGPDGITGFLRAKDPRFSRPFMSGPDHPPGTFTDDTQMSIAVANALLAKGHASRDELMQEFGRQFVAWYFGPENNQVLVELWLHAARARRGLGRGGGRRLGALLLVASP